MSLEHLILGSLVVIEATIGWLILAYVARLAREAHEKLDAVMQGQEHIAALAAEVLRRTPGR